MTPFSESNRGGLGALNAARYFKRAGHLLRQIIGYASPVSLSARFASKLIGLQQFDKADRIIKCALIVWPEHSGLLELYALSAHNSARYVVAMQRWQHLRELHPGIVMAWCGVAANARELGDLCEAREIIGEALDKYPRDLMVLTEAGRIFDRSAEYDEALRQWQLAIDSPLPVHPEWCRAHARDLVRLRRFGEAERAIETALESFPDDPDLKSISLEAHREHARYLIRLRRFGEADRAVKTALERFPHDPDLGSIPLELLREHARDLIKLRRFGEAESAVKTALERFPNDPNLTSISLENLREHARDLVESKRYGDAEKVVQTALDRFPGDPDLTYICAKVHMSLQNWREAYFAWSNCMRDCPDATDVLYMHFRSFVYGFEPLQKVQAGNDYDERRDIMLSFESIGCDCEFGLVQRFCGAGPLGLLRWNSVDLHPLLQALSIGFSGMGSIHHTRLEADNANEYHVVDRRWSFDMHTFCEKKNFGHDDLLQEMCRRIVFLRNKFLADLFESKKIFVYHNEWMGLEDLFHLHDALCKFGPVKFLYVMKAQAPGVAAGVVLQIKRNLYVGFVDRFGTESGVWDIDYENWISICRNVRLAAANI